MSLSHDAVSLYLDDLRERLTKKFGVTLVEDDFGEHGSMGARYLTLRWKDAEGNFIQVSTQVLNIEVDEPTTK